MLHVVSEERWSLLFYRHPHSRLDGSFSGNGLQRLWDREKGAASSVGFAREVRTVHRGEEKEHLQSDPVGMSWLEAPISYNHTLLVY